MTLSDTFPKAVTGPRLQAILPKLALSLCLCVALRIAHVVQHHSPDGWMVCALGLAGCMANTRYDRVSEPALRLWRLLAFVSGFYALIHYPLMAPLPSHAAHVAYAVLLGLWVLSLVSTIACLRIASLAIIPPTYLVWSSLTAARITGLPHANILDIVPLAEVSLCLAIGLALQRLFDWCRRQRWTPLFLQAASDTSEQFVWIVLWLSICVHLANYFWSAVAKFELPGPVFGWVRYNNPAYIYLTALDDDHVLFQSYAGLTHLFLALLNNAHFVTNIVVFLAQAIAIVGLLLPKRLLLILLIIFDVMHLSIALAAGANFWPWIILNLAIASIVARKDYRQPAWPTAVGCSLFILASIHLVSVAYLGWYDTGANNKEFVLAEDRSGKRYYVSPNFFTFYSYPFAHMDYGVPDPQTAFAVGHPNGGAYSFKAMEDDRRCDVPALTAGNSEIPAPDPGLGPFIINYMALALRIERRTGLFPYNVYPHHFYERWTLMAPFNALEKDQIAAYIYRRESVCLSIVNGDVRRRVVSSGEVRFEVPHE